MRWLSLEATASVAYKEFLHIYRDRRVLLLVLLLPPLFTLLFGHAFETSELTDVPCMLVNRDNTPRAQEFIDIISKNKTFRWRYGSPDIQNESDLLADHVRAAEHFNRCRAAGIAGSPVDFLICAAAERLAVPIFTTDLDFPRFARHVPIRLFRAPAPL